MSASEMANARAEAHFKAALAEHASETALDRQRREAVEWAASRWSSLTPEARAAIGDAAREHRRAAGLVKP